MEHLIDAEQLDAIRRRCQYVIDARSPAEFAEDHIPGARNVPALDDAQRAEIGALYKRDAFAARKRGALYALAAVQRFVASPLAQDAPRGTAFLIYCARGGQRSAALATVLAQIGFAVFRLKRGYKSYRAYVLNKLAEPLPGPVFALYGYTGSRKTHILHALRDRFNVVDLEGLAAHRGSILGDLPGRPQPCQRAFESALVEAVRGLDPDKPTLLEGESRRIGKLAVPNPLWRQLKAARALWLDMPRERRIANILEDYRELKDPRFLEPRLARLARYISKRDMASMLEDMHADRWPAVVASLLTAHYDPLYARSTRRDCLTLAAAGFEEAVAAVAEAVAVAAATPRQESSP